jgi:hypothetical protein
MPDFISGVNLDELGDELQGRKATKASGVFLSADGASHDSS